MSFSDDLEKLKGEYITYITLLTITIQNLQDQKIRNYFDDVCTLN
jgi:hypothetical protein